MRRTVSFLLAVLFLLPVLLSPSFFAVGNPFSDVTSDNYYYDAVMWAVENGITFGTSDTTFIPFSACTRGQTVTFLWRIAGSPKPQGERCIFVDVPYYAHYWKPVIWATENGITNGTSVHDFSPHRSVTRGQVVTFLYRFANAKEPVIDCVFDDVEESKYYYDAVRWAYGTGVTDGITDTRFKPDELCTRAQIVTFLWRFVMRAEVTESVCLGSSDHEFATVTVPATRTTNGYSVEKCSVCGFVKSTTAGESPLGH